MNQKNHLLIVSSVDKSRKFFKKIIGDKFDFSFCKSYEEAIEFFDNRMADLIIIDINIEVANGGLWLISLLKNDHMLKYIPIIAISDGSREKGEIKCFEAGASDFILYSCNSDVIIKRIERVLSEYEQKKYFKSEIKRKNEKIEEITLSAIMSIVDAIDRKDILAAGHSARVAEYSKKIAEKLGWSESETNNMYYIALLHDIGKIGISKDIIGKPDKLTHEEYEIVKKHTFAGEKILKNITVVKNVTEGALYHHEMYNGEGYIGLKGEEIPISARIIHIADAFDAMTTDRIYRRRLNIETVKNELIRGKGEQFDPKITDVMLNLIDENEILNIVDDENISLFSEGSILHETGKLFYNVLDEYAEGMKDEARKDSLTRVWNRKYTEENINRYLSDNRAAGYFFMMDLDNFKTVNDTRGHIAGDEVLIKFSEILRSETRDDDVICRIGGDEFIVFFKGKAMKGEIERKAETIFGKAEKQLSSEDGNSNVSVSIGIAYAPDDGNSFEELYMNADKALYCAKRSGKNCCCFYNVNNEYNEETQINGKIDLQYLRDFISENGGEDGESTGVYKVEYEAFRKIYNFLRRSISRTGQKIQLVLFTLTDREGNFPNIMYFEDAVNSAEKAVSISLRRGDVATICSSSQILVILTNASFDDGNIVAKRILNNFFRIHDNQEVMMCYEIQEMRSITEEEKN